jgi:uncharacterized protein YhhL (DUF1145 family)
VRPGRLVVIGSLVLVLVNVLEPGFVHVRMFVRVAAAVFVLVLVLDVLVVVRQGDASVEWPTRGSPWVPAAANGIIE